MIFLYLYFILGIIIAAVLYSPEPGETVRQEMLDGFICVFGWPVIVISVIINRKGDK